ncbi:hypothetical protein HDU98_006485 [Podochytrium sp. JEL0797]|nr:hypothetical protein HDU98_006485 [Podochytrium sp. JEL0797]
MASEPPNITSKYIQALEFKADTLEAENLDLKRRLESALVENATLQKQAPQPQPATPTPTNKIRTTIKESLESVATNPRLYSLLVENATRKKHVPPPQPPTSTPVIQTRSMRRESLESVAKKLRLATASPPLLLRGDSDASDILHQESPPPSPEFRRQNLSVSQKQESPEQQPSRRNGPVGQIRCSSPTCNTTFTTNKEQSDHVYNYHTTHANVTFLGREEKVHVERRADGRVHCPCGKNYTAWSSLRRHAKTCDGTSKIQDSDSDANPTSSQPALASTVAAQPPQNALASHRTIITQIMPDYPTISSPELKAIDEAVIEFLENDSQVEVTRAQNGDIGIPEALKLAAETLKEQNSHLKEQVGSLLVENATLKEQVPLQQPATATPAIQIRSMCREPLDPESKKPRLAAASPSSLLRDESDGFNFSYRPDIFDDKSPSKPPKLRSRKLPAMQTRSSAEQQPTSEKDPGEEFQCPTPTSAESDSDANTPSAQSTLAAAGKAPNAPVSHRTILSQVMPDFPTLPSSQSEDIDRAVISFLDDESGVEVNRDQNGGILIPEDLTGRFQEWVYQALKKRLWIVS